MHQNLTRVEHELEKYYTLVSDEKFTKQPLNLITGIADGRGTCSTQSAKKVETHEGGEL